MANKTKSLSTISSEIMSSDISLIGKLQKIWPDLLILIFLAVMIAIASYQLSQHLGNVFSHEGDVWFETDTQRVINDMTDRSSNHSRTIVHPLFPLITYPVTNALMTVFKMTPFEAVRIVIALIASLWIITLFTILRIIGCRRFDGALFSILGATSSSVMFWCTVPETYPLGSLSILLALGIVAFAQNRNLFSFYYVIGSALTLSITVTNWMAGIIAAFVKFPWRRALQITVNAFCIIVLLWAVEHRFFSKVPFFLTGSNIEKRYILTPESGGLINVTKSFFYHSMIMPAIEIRQKVKLKDNSLMSIMVTQTSPPGSGSLWGIIAVALWTVLLGLGLWSLIFLKQNKQLRVALGLTLLGQFTLHLLYGPETFLYSLHFAPLLVILAAMSTLTRARPLVLILTSALIIFLAINNNLQFKQAIEIFQHLVTY
jgi:hypothetical protein